jgi:hypothetical protein
MDKKILFETHQRNIGLVFFIFLNIICIILAFDIDMSNDSVPLSLLLLVIFEWFFYQLLVVPIKKFRFFENHLEIISPFKLNPKRQVFDYGEINFVRITERPTGRVPDTLVVDFKDGKRIKVPIHWYEFNKDQKLKIEQHFEIMSVNFHYRSWNKVRKPQNSNWTEITNDLK